MNDVELYETGNGGDVRLVGRDLNLVDGISNMPYMSCFGGKKWFGNAMLPDEGRGVRFSAETEELLNSIALNSAAPPKIQQAVARDLQYLEQEFPGTKLIVTVQIAGPKRVDIGLNLNGEEISLVWNPKPSVEDPILPLPPCPLPLGLALTGVTVSGFTASWGASGAGAYQYAYNTTGDVPTSWTETAATSVAVSGLEENTTYYFFVRSLCYGSVPSPEVSASTTTPIAPPVLPITGNLKMSCWSTVGVTESGGDITAMADQSGVGNDVAVTSLLPELVPGVFGTKPGIRFRTESGMSTIMQTAGNMVGISGQQKMTVYVVLKMPLPSGGARHVWAYAAAPGSVSAGEAESYGEFSTGNTKVTCIARGNVGFDVGTMVTTPDVGYVYSYVIDFSQLSASELSMWKDNDDTDFTLNGSANNTGNFAAAPFSIGEQNMYIGGWAVYAAAHNASERGDITDYLKAYFGL